MPIIDRLKSNKSKILILGSGPLSIGQAGEFDYSGSQAIRAILEEGHEVILINPNIATVQTNPEPNKKVYLYPLTLEWITKVIDLERPDCLMAGFGGQTALNAAIELEKFGILEKYQILNLGTSIKTLELTEDRDDFAKNLKLINIPIPESIACNTVEEGLFAANQIGFPVIVRAAYALGGLGSGKATTEDELIKLISNALINSPQVLVEKSLHGHKELEYEVMRDRFGNVICICNMENLDPLGVHTGDSIVIVPSQTLSNEDYQRLRDASIKIVNHFNIVGECNVQFAVCPNSKKYYVIEINARLSRSSALASKASGYPIAYIAAKVCMGYSLTELKNPLTQVSSALYEPALDYVVIKYPRWDLHKFQGVTSALGTSMKSVGEVMAIGRNFPETLKKSMRMVFEKSHFETNYKYITNYELLEKISIPSPRRIEQIFELLRRNVNIQEIFNYTKIDLWFLKELEFIITLELKLLSKRIIKDNISDTIRATLDQLSVEELKILKMNGFSDEEISYLIIKDHFEHNTFKEFDWQKISLFVRNFRKENHLIPVIKKIDSTAGEFPTDSNYLYLSYHGTFNDVSPIHSDGVIIIGSGSYRIGSSVEFDWSAVMGTIELKHSNLKSIMINCNPETVSTDYSVSDRLYFEDLQLERILDIYEFEKSRGLITSLGGQLPNNLLQIFDYLKTSVLGNSFDIINMAEDRTKFSTFLEKLGIDQPRFTYAFNPEDIKHFIEKVGFPLLVRPSHVLSGSGMKVATTIDELENDLKEAREISPFGSVLLTEYFENALEVELDGVAKNGDVIISLVSEHIEQAGIHSGDASHLIPAHNLGKERSQLIKSIGAKIIQNMNLTGPFNFQFLVIDQNIKVIECNARASRSFPFVSKVTGINLASLSTQALIDKPLTQISFDEFSLKKIGAKSAMFSFKRLEGVDPVLGVEMMSTGESGCIAKNSTHALWLALQSTGLRFPQRGILLSTGKENEKALFLKHIDRLKSLNLKIFSTPGTHQYFTQHGIQTELVDWTEALNLINKKQVDLVLNIPKNYRRNEMTNGKLLRTASIRNGITLLTNAYLGDEYFKALNSIEEIKALVPEHLH